SSVPLRRPGLVPWAGMMRGDGLRVHRQMASAPAGRPGPVTRAREVRQRHPRSGVTERDRGARAGRPGRGVAHRLLGRGPVQPYNARSWCAPLALLPLFSLFGCDAGDVGMIAPGADAGLDAGSADAGPPQLTCDELDGPMDFCDDFATGAMDAWEAEAGTWSV